MENIIKYPLEKEINQAVESDGYYELVWVKKDKEGKTIAEIKSEEPLDRLVDIHGTLVGVDKDFRKTIKRAVKTLSGNIKTAVEIEKEAYVWLEGSKYICSSCVYELREGKMLLIGKLATKIKNE